MGRAHTDENGQPHEMHGKQKTSNMQTRAAADVLGVHNRLEPKPQAMLFDLKKPRDYAISLLQPRNSLGPSPTPATVNRKRTLGVVADLNDKHKHAPLSIAQDEVQTPPAGLNHPPEVSSEPDRLPEESHGGRTVDKAGDLKDYLPSHFDPSYLPYEAGPTTGVPSVNEAAQVALGPATQWDRSKKDYPFEPSRHDDDESPRTLYVTNPDPEPSPSLALPLSADGYLNTARSEFLEDFVEVQKRMNKHAPLIPSRLNPIRDYAPTKAWLMLKMPFANRFKTSISWSMKTPLGSNDSGILGNKHRNESLYKLVLSGAFKRFRAAQAVQYSPSSNVDTDSGGSGAHPDPPSTPTDDEPENRPTNDGGDDDAESDSESSQGDDDEGGDSNMPPLLRRLKRARRHSSPEPYIATLCVDANSSSEVPQEGVRTTAKRARVSHLVKEAGKSSNAERCEQDFAFVMYGDQGARAVSASRARKRERKSPLPSSSTSTEKVANTKPPKKDAAYHCPLEGCTHTATQAGDMARHLQSKKHATHTYMCLDGRCLQVFAREDSLKRHYSKTRVEHKAAHERRVEEGHPFRVPISQVEEVRRVLAVKSD